MKNLRTKRKLFLVFSIIAIMAAIAGIAGIVGLATLNSRSNKMYVTAQSANNATLLIRNIQAQRAAFRGAPLKYFMGLDFESDIDDLNDLNIEFTKLLSELETAVTLKENKQYFSDVRKTYNEKYIPKIESLIILINNGEEENMNILLQELTTPIDTIITNLNAVSQSSLNFIDGMNISNNRTAVILISILTILIIITIGLALFFAFYLTKLTAVPLLQMAGEINNKLALGNLKINAEVNQKDEIGILAEGIKTMIKDMLIQEQNIMLLAEGDFTVSFKARSEDDIMNKALEKLVVKFNAMVKEINTSSEQVASASKQIAHGAQALAQGSTDQAAAVEQLSASITEIEEKTKENAKKADLAAKLTETIKKSAEMGHQNMNDMMVAVKEINIASHNISDVIKLISDIAFQTNILSLNAAVEAARAGQQGNGFDVVAKEVRNLAAKSAEAVKDTADLITVSIEKAELGAHIADKTAESLKAIVTGIDESSKIAFEIALLSEEQSIGIMQINKGIEQVADVISQNSATAEESAASSEQMSGQAIILNNILLRFKTKQDE